MDFPRTGLALIVAVTVASAPAWAARPGEGTKLVRPLRAERVERVATVDNLRRIDVNQVNMFVTNYGSFAWDISAQGQPPGLYFPKGTNKTAVFAAGLWIGAVVDADGPGGPGLPEVRALVAEYSQEYGPGAMVGNTFDDPGKSDYKVYKVVRYSSPEDTTHLERDANEASREDPLIHHSWNEYRLGAAPYGAPTRVYRLPLTDTSDPVDSIDIVGPDVAGDMMMWSVYNDANAANHSNDAGNSSPLGVEIQHKTFSFNRQGSLGNIVFLEYKIINKGGLQLDSMFVSLWSDTDLGGAADDLVGVDTLLSLGFTYNSTNNDQLYGSAPPAIGYDFFKGPEWPPGNVLPMTSFNKYINGTDPHSTSDTYNYMNGLLPDGNAVIDPTTDQPTKFFHPGNPVTKTGWLDSNPADRRHLLTSGPFYMAPGDTQTVVAAMVIGLGNDRLSSVEAMKFYDTDAQDAFDRGFQLANPPPQPKVIVALDHGQVQLCWDAASRLNYNEPGYTFEGYNVYQGESIAGPWKRLATFDEVNGILTVRDTVFDINTGRTITDYPVAYGTDAGIQFCYTATEDAVRGGPLHDATEYFFAVTAYGVSPTERQAVVENAQVPIRVIPQRAASGTDLSTASTLCPTFFRVDSMVPPTSDQVVLNVVNPDSVNGHNYRITFSPLNPPFPIGELDATPGPDTVTVGWNLIDITAGDTLLTNQINKAGNGDYRVFDGVQVKVVGQHAPANAFAGVAYYDASCNTISSPNIPFAGVSAGMEALGGGAGTSFAFFGTSTLTAEATPDSFHSVEIRFSNTATQKAYRFLREETAGGGTPDSGRAYSYAGFHTQPFTVWDIVTGEQLDVAYVERGVTAADGTLLGPGQQVATFDSTWAPVCTSCDGNDTGGREYLFILKTPYSDTPKPHVARDGSIADSTLAELYSAWVRLRSPGVSYQPGDIFRYNWGAQPATANDIIEFGTTTLVRGNTALAKTGLERIRAVPNPYYNQSRYELNQFARIIRFVNMPEQATVRIFNLAGQLVRTLHKTNASSSILEWDILTENQLPVASGIYIYHVEAPGAGTTFGRMVVFMEKERLNNF